MSERDGFRAAVDRAMLANDALAWAIEQHLEDLSWPTLLRKIDAAYVKSANEVKPSDWVSLAGMCLEAARMSTPAVEDASGGGVS